jgi:hypothetical protein
MESHLANGKFLLMALLVLLLKLHLAVQNTALADWPRARMVHCM